LCGCCVIRSFLFVVDAAAVIGGVVVVIVVVIGIGEIRGDKNPQFISLQVEESMGDISIVVLQGSN
jgi:hypothetical protein